ncbi:MAG: hypothetical protein BWK73_20055 [Thiothrix lacustris]|uniref:Hint domain-containing protein n=1 Tax=Thiothrix lacustris TaxID=525917 RepID=A0A1Y1QPP5_9GAMM|nr:MAG: hypothetical protein BWK73_20055 [Thiothrix lacustris]
MFQGEILSTTGWKKPELGDTIAALDPSTNRLVWKTITSHGIAESPLINVRNERLNYTISPDHSLLLRHRPHQTRFHEYAATDIADALARISKERLGQVRWSHTTSAVPLARHSAHGLRFHKHHQAAAVLAHWGRLDSCVVDIIPSHPDFFQMGCFDAAQALAEVSMWWRDTTKTLRTWVIESKYVDHLQAVFLMNNIYSVVKGNRITARLGTHRNCTPLAPVLSSRTALTPRIGLAHSIDVKHPFVRNEGMVCAL